MITEEELDRYRVEGTPLRVVRDNMEANDVLGIVVAWDAESVVIRKRNRRVVKLSRGYIYEPVGAPRSEV
ncbi:hypothetical protein SAMN02799624_00038 [Paenibacillus sp. UNC496MF]|uniref:hypothetical protein n=1 Tax=Paenibacillus sp. UNC496MF TaxID=1502753 RepID=UPI0008E7FF4B|nr:hypothetical protein [Paenibacillus sp. UNC496MF]SFI27373.1 hypothetical protein SAMN02799624_00038 [Paenibacillus sp. UNC496MF]